MDASSAEEFVRLFSKSQHRILGFIHTLVPNLPEAEDVLQETSVILWKKWPEFQRDRDFVKWACGIARFEVFRILRQNKRTALYISESVLEQIADIALEDSKNNDRFEDTGTALSACLQELPESYQQIINFRYQYNKTVQQIAKECGRPKSTVHDLLGKIRSRLLRCIRRRLSA